MPGQSAVGQLWTMWSGEAGEAQHTPQTLSTNNGKGAGGKARSHRA